MGVIKTVEAVIDKEGNVRLLDSIDLPTAGRAFVMILDESPTDAQETALLSERALAQDWTRPEEDAAWSHLQRAR